MDRIEVVDFQQTLEVAGGIKVQGQAGWQWRGKGQGQRQAAGLAGGAGR